MISAIGVDEPTEFEESREGKEKICLDNGVYSLIVHIVELAVVAPLFVVVGGLVFTWQSSTAPFWANSYGQSWANKQPRREDFACGFVSYGIDCDS